MQLSKYIYKSVAKSFVEATFQPLSSFRMIEADTEDMQDMKAHVEFIAGVLAIHGATWEKVHPFHPMNISRFAYNWFYLGEKEQADFKIDDEQMCLSLGIALGQFARDMYGMHWCNVAQMDKARGEQVPVEYGLYIDGLEIPYTPISTLLEEVQKAKLGWSVVMLQIIGERVCPDYDLKNTTQNVAEHNFGNLLYYAKMTGQPDDMYRFYTAVLSLEKWYFVATDFAGDDYVVNDLDGVRKYMAFVDEKDAWRYAMDRTRVRSLSSVDALDLLREKAEEDISGIQFASGDDTWYFSTEALTTTLTELKDKGVL